ncbi:MAG: tetratricopeptide repeat protein [Gemmataceae bacterium]|nr:tetratricopeptide repeat protein [Gemmataceae bacterium]MDW8242671.1 tetratricopeptide repeat protein [Thermogemmata sp.]
MSQPRRWQMRLLLASLSLLVLAALGGIAWYWWPSRLPEPPLVDSEEAEVSQVIQEHYQKVLRQRRSASAWGEYGTILLAHLFDQQADECFAVAARLDPQDPRWPYARAHIALKRRPLEAVALLRQAAAASRHQPHYQMVCELTLAETLLEQGAIAEAIEYFRRYVSPPPGEPRAHFGLAVAALNQGEIDEAWTHLWAVRDHPCCRKQAHTQLAALARQRGDLTAARQYESIAQMADPDPPWPDPYLDYLVSVQVGRRGLQRRAGLLERDGRFFEAAQLYLRALRDEKTVEALVGAAVNLARLHQHPEALKLLDEAVVLDPADARAQYTLALVQYAYAEIVQSHQPHHPQLREWFQKAAAAARRAVELKPDHARAYLFYGLALLQLGDPQTAVTPFRQGLAIEPDNFDMHLALGQALARLGQHMEAEKALQTAAQLRPDDPRPAEELRRLRSPR